MSLINNINNRAYFCLGQAVQHTHESIPLMTSTDADYGSASTFVCLKISSGLKGICSKCWLKGT